jgi:hypothetical protein
MIGVSMNKKSVALAFYVSGVVLVFLSVANTIYERLAHNSDKSKITQAQVETQNQISDAPSNDSVTVHDSIDRDCKSCNIIPHFTVEQGKQIDNGVDLWRKALGVESNRVRFPMFEAMTSEHVLASTAENEDSLVFGSRLHVYVVIDYNSTRRLDAIAICSVGRSLGVAKDTADILNPKSTHYMCITKEMLEDVAYTHNLDRTKLKAVCLSQDVTL